MTTTWTRRDSDAAVREGWDVFQAEMELQIQRIDAPDDGMEPIFDDDTGAWRYVWDRAQAGSRLHRRALNVLREQSRSEFLRLLDHCAGLSYVL